MPSNRALAVRLVATMVPFVIAIELVLRLAFHQGWLRLSLIFFLCVWVSVQNYRRWRR